MAKKILVCDDQEIVREIVSNFLLRKGYEVIMAASGEECLKLLQKEEFDSVFLDIKMPGIDGLTVLKKIDALKIQVQVILMSGHHVYPESTLNHQNLRFLSKPFSLDSVLQVLNMKKENAVNRILIVDDQDMLREMLKDFLSKKGYEIVEASNGKECIEAAKKQTFDAIFMDVRMPEMDGIAALELLREQGINTPVFIMSGYGEVTCFEDAKKRGAQNFLSKPFRLENALDMLTTGN